ncbi:carboxypeptidase M32 [Longirhabdus pacifica]|uniref:carboxypeptidase M32 n=1 Tax=Longirhabdus pacifica TaxID=2305227 RepID=UPI001008C02B|nr:carboxypeptidase M32 [Longirhabdus pacifica]
MTDAITTLRELDKKINYYGEAISLMYWDLRTHAPKNSVKARSQSIGLLSTEQFKLSTSDEMGTLLESCSEEQTFAKLSEMDQKLVKMLKKQYDRSKKIPTEMYQKFVELTTTAESVWEDAKGDADFASFQPYLEEIVEYNKKFAEIWGYEDNPYNALIEDYETGMTVETLDRVFAQVKERIVPLVAKVREAEQPDTSFLKQPLDIEQQKKLGEFVLKEIGYDFQSGRIDETVHPFMIDINHGDIRVTTAYKENDFMFSFGSTAHEGGHALYEQNIAEKLAGTSLCSGTSMGIHESQSRFWENQIGLSYEFWEKYYSKLKEFFPGKFDDVALDDFYAAINQAAPNLIRIEADELTYNLHIMIRYELEKSLISGELKVADLPQAWNKKYEEYLGITPSHDGEGVLQDVHWSGGSFGYFPTYSLGNMYAAQITHVMKQEMPAYEQHIREGNFSPIKAWLTDKVYRHGKMLTPNELIQDIAGEELNPQYLIEYMEEKFTKIYNF